MYGFTPWPARLKSGHYRSGKKNQIRKAYIIKKKEKKKGYDSKEKLAEQEDDNNQVSCIGYGIDNP